ncbi:MAG: T9SS C-terminal target domain-containing protein [Calditrichaeota bacterium]|nr:MAG: T9SS C-terminal target domain-containing protein [Calditrichota bacterium]
MKKNLLSLTLLLVCVISSAFAQFDFRSFNIVNSSAGIKTDSVDTRAAGFGDFNGDGFFDLYVANVGTPNEIYMNDANPDPITGAVTFTDISLSSLADFTGNSVAVAIADYDNDGFDDVFVATQNEGHLLYKSFGNGTFINQPDTVSKIENASTAAWGDFDNDGYVDLLVGVFEGNIHLYQNQAGQGWEDVAQIAGLTGLKGVQDISLTDINQDGLLDIYLVKGGSLIDSQDEIYINYSNPLAGTISFVQENVNYNITSTLDGYAADFGDIDNDQDYDMYLGVNGPNSFFRNTNGIGLMTDETAVTGTGSSAFTRGVMYTDIDLNGYNDIFLLNENANPRMYFTGNGTSFTNKFVDLLGASGYSAQGGERGLCAADFDNDGDEDFFVPVSGGQNMLIRNICASNQSPSSNDKYGNELDIIFCGAERWLGLNLQGQASNFRGVGARVVFHALGYQWVRTVTGNGSPASQSSYRITLGFESTVNTLDSLEIFWPSGIVQKQFNVPTNQIMTIVETGVADIVCAEVIAPPDSVESGITVFPTVVFQNQGATPVSFVAYAQIDSAGLIIWSGFLPGIELGYLEVDTLFFGGWTPQGVCLDEVEFSVEAFVTGDTNPANNNCTKIVTLTGQNRFVDITSDVFPNSPSSGSGYGAAWADIDNNGYLDLMHIKGNTNLMFMNNGDGTFTQNMASGMGLSGTGGTKRATIIADFDNDEDLDMIVGQNIFLHNGNFGSPLYSQAGVSITGFSGSTQGVSAFDMDNDTYLDFYVGRDGNSTDLLFHSSGPVPPSNNLTFVEKGIALNIAYLNTDPREPWQRHTHTVTCADYNQDGWVDIYAGHDNHSGQFNRMFRNNKLDANGLPTPYSLVTGPFAPSANPPQADSIGAGHDDTWGSAFGDYNNDGLIDIFISATDISATSIKNLLYEHHINTPYPTIPDEFIDVAPIRGVDGVNPTQTWESGWADYNNDGWLDLFVGQVNFNSHLYQNFGNDFAAQNMGLQFQDVAQLLSIPSYLNQVTGVSWADYNNDGLVDVFVGTQSGQSRLLKNEICNIHNWIYFDLKGTASNYSAIGARATLYANGMKQYRQVIGGVGRSMESLWLEFGIGEAEWIDSLVIDWPSGLHQTVYNGEVEINQINPIVEGVCQPVLTSSPTVLNFTGGVLGTVDSMEVVLYNNSDCFASITDIRGKFPYNAILTASETDFVMEPQTSDTIWVYYLHLFEQLTTSLEIIYNAPQPYEIPVIAGTCDFSAVANPSYLEFTLLPATWEDSLLLEIQNPNGDCELAVENMYVPAPFDTIWTFDQVVPFVIPPSSNHSFWVKFKSPGAQQIASELVVEIANSATPTIVPLISNGCLPTLAVSPSQLDFGGGELLEADTLQLYITNTDATCFLAVTELDIPAPYDTMFTYDPLLFPMIIDPSTQDSVAITFRRYSLDTLATTLTVLSNSAQTSPVVNLNGFAILTDIEETENQPIVVSEYSLKQNYPNPFNPSTTITYEIPENGFTKLAIYDIKGRLVNELVNRQTEAGSHKAVWNGTDSQGNKVSSGIYFYRLVSNKFVETKKMVLLK